MKRSLSDMFSRVFFGSTLALSLVLGLPLSQSAWARPSTGWVSTTLEGGGANLRAAPSTNAAISATARNGTQFSIVEERLDSLGYRWYQVRLDTVTLASAVWLRSDLISFVPPFPVQPRLGCDRAIAETEKTIRAVANTQIRTRNQRPHGYANGPAARPDSFSYILTGTGADNILASPVFMNQMAAQLIENCSQIGLVSFSDSPTDGSYINYGLMPERLVRPFQCKLGPSSDRGSAQWGESLCL